MKKTDGGRGLYSVYMEEMLVYIFSCVMVSCLSIFVYSLLCSVSVVEKEVFFYRNNHQ